MKLTAENEPVAERRRPRPLRRRSRPEELKLSRELKRIYRGARHHFPWKKRREGTLYNEYVARHQLDSDKVPDLKRILAEDQDWVALIVNHGWYWCLNRNEGDQFFEPVMCVLVHWWGYAGRATRACTWEIIWPGRWPELVAEYFMARFLDPDAEHLGGTAWADTTRRHVMDVAKDSPYAAKERMKFCERSGRPVPVLNMTHEITSDFRGLRELLPGEQVTWPTILENLPGVPVAPHLEDEGYNSEETDIEDDPEDQRVPMAPSSSSPSTEDASLDADIAKGMIGLGKGKGKRYIGMRE